MSFKQSLDRVHVLYVDWGLVRFEPVRVTLFQSLSLSLSLSLLSCPGVLYVIVAYGTWYLDIYKGQISLPPYHCLSEPGFGEPRAGLCHVDVTATNSTATALCKQTHNAKLYQTEIFPHNAQTSDTFFSSIGSPKHFYLVKYSLDRRCKQTLNIIYRVWRESAFYRTCAECTCKTQQAFRKLAAIFDCPELRLHVLIKYFFVSIHITVYRLDYVSR